MCATADTRTISLRQATFRIHIRIRGRIWFLWFPLVLLFPFGSASVPLRVPLIRFSSPLVPFGSLRFPLVPFGSIWFPLAPFGSIWFPLVPFGFLWFPLVPFGSLWSPLIPFGSI